MMSPTYHVLPMDNDVSLGEGASLRTSASSHNQLKVLVCAYACNPERGSEEGVGWGWIRAMAERYEVTVITADFHRDDIASHCKRLNTEIQKNLNFLYVQNKPWHYRPRGLWLQIESSAAKPIMNLAYQDWLRHAYRLAQIECAKQSFDLIHLITYIGWRFPGRFYRLNIPFVWGPIGGLINTPTNLFPALGVKGAIYYCSRNLINSIQIRLLRGPRRALRKANGAVIAATSEIQHALSLHFGSTSVVMCEVGLPDISTPQIRLRKKHEPLQICWSGMHLPGKALHLLLHAISRLPADVQYTLHILGNGPSTHDWRSLATKLGVESRCKWYGQLTRTGALEVMQASHLFIITSLKDLTSSVAIEALALGLPIVCINHCGFADVVTPECGLKIEPSSVGDIISGLCTAVQTLYHDEALRYWLANGAIARSQEYAWSFKMSKLHLIYESVLN